MENGSNLPWEYNALIDELTQGMEKAKLLHLHLSSTSPVEGQDLLLQRILSSYDKSLSILKWKGSSPAGQAQVPALVLGGPESSVSADASSRSEDLNKRLRDGQDFTASKKRKLQPKWTEQVRINSETGLDGPTDDGFSWRKYGQKDILGAKYPRSYYRCTYRHIQNCWASKQVQRSDKDPNVFEVTYKGAHTCNQSSHPVPLPPSPDQTIQTSENHQEQHNRELSSFKANLRVTTDNLDNTNNNNKNKNEVPPQYAFPLTYEECYDFPISSLIGEDNFGPQSSLFLSPATSCTSYISPVASYHMQGFGGNYNYQNQETDISEIISANASTANSPIGGMEFRADPYGLDPDFSFNYYGYFT